MNKQGLLRTQLIGLILIRGLLSVYMVMMHNSLTIFGKIVIIRWSQRQGNFKTPFARTSHLARVRVVVK